MLNGSRRPITRALLAALAVLLAIGIVVWARGVDTSPPWTNRPLPGPELNASRAGASRWIANRDPSLLVAVSISGGGARAAAFGYGVLRELQDTRFEWNGEPTDLLAATDVISGVSGGSIIAAYYAAFGAQSLPRFEQEFLRSDFQDNLLWQALKPANLVRLATSEFGRSQLLERRLDTLFRGLTFGDLMAREHHPELLITATDLAQGAGFAFTPEQFDLLCSDFESVPLSFAVAASSAVPLLLSPMALRNFSQHCSERGIEQPIPTRRGSSFRARLYERQERSYLDGAARPFIHLVDGGVADNLGIRRLLDRSLAGASIRAGFEEVDVTPGTVRKLVLVTVNAERDPSVRLDETGGVPGPLLVIDAMRFGAGSRATHETQEFLRDLADEWRASLQRPGKDSVFAPNAEIYTVQVNLRDTPAPQSERIRLLQIPTAFSIPAAEAERLVEAGRSVLRNNPSFLELRSALHASRAANR